MMRRKLCLLCIFSLAIDSLLTGCGKLEAEKEKDAKAASSINNASTEFISSDKSSRSLIDDQTTQATTDNSTSEQETKEQNTDNLTSNEVVSDSEISALSNEKQEWGVGVQVYDDNRPVSPVMLQNSYGNKYKVKWIMENEPNIYLTFDEGYENGYTAKILDVLKEKSVKAVFFVTMPYVKTEAELVKRIIDEGHILGAHSVTHPSGGMPSLSLEAQKSEYTKLHQYVKETYKYDMWLFRPPTGAFSEQSLAIADAMGYTTIQWSFAYADWNTSKQWTVDRALDNAVGKLHNGAIYLLHAVSSTNAEMLSSFIDKTLEKGYTFKLFQK